MEAVGRVQVFGVAGGEERVIVEDPVAGGAGAPRLLARQGRDAGDGGAVLGEDDLLARGGAVGGGGQVGLGVGEVTLCHACDPTGLAIRPYCRPRTGLFKHASGAWPRRSQPSK